MNPYGARPLGSVMNLPDGLTPLPENEDPRRQGGATPVPARKPGMMGGAMDSKGVSSLADILAAFGGMLPGWTGGRNSGAMMPTPGQAPRGIKTVL